MNRLLIKVFAVVSIFLGVVAILITPKIWESKIRSELNVLVPGELSFSEISGHPFTRIVLTNLNYIDPKLGRFKAEKITVKIDLISSLLHKPSLNYLNVSGLFADLKTDGSNSNKTQEDSLHFIFEDLPHFKLNNIHMDGQINLNGREVEPASFRFKGKINSEKDRADLYLKEIKISNESFGNELTLNNGAIHFLLSQAEIQGIKGNFGNTEFESDGIIKYSSNLSLNLALSLSKIDSVIAGIKNPIKSSTINLNVNGSQIDGQMTLEIDSTKTIDGSFNFNLNPEYIRIDQFAFFMGPSSINVEGVYETNGRLAGRAKVASLDLKDWITFDRNTNVDGLIMFESDLINGQINNTMLTVELMESKISKNGMVSISGTVVYKDKMVSITDPVLFEFGNSIAIADGFYNTLTRDVNLDFDLSKADVSLLNNFIKDPIESGAFTGNFIARGNMDNPSLKLELNGENVKYKGFSLESVTTNADLRSDSSRQVGNIRIDFGRGMYNNQYGFNQGSGDIIIDEDKIQLKNIYFTHDDDYVQLDGVYHNSGLLEIPRMQVAWQDHYVVNATPLSLLIDKAGNLNAKPFTLHIDDGILEGEISFENEVKGLLKATNVDADIFHPFIEDEKYRFYGNVFGELQTFSIDGKQNFTLEASIKNGNIAKWNFDDLIMSIGYSDGILNIEELVMTYGQKTGFELAGIIPLDTTFSVSDRLIINSSYRNFDLELIQSMLLPNFFHFGGITSGQVNVSGSLINTKVQFDLVANDAEFDILDLDKVSIKGNYDGKRLNLEHMSSNSKNNSINGSGFVPFDFNVGSPTFGRFFQEDPIFLDIKGKTNQIRFLTDYITDVDSIPGNFDIHLVLRGPMSSISREGSIKISNADIYTTLLDDPVTGVNASGLLNNNLLTITSFSGNLLNPRKNNKGGKATATGTIDLTKFFEPKYDLKLKGKNNYFRTLTGDIEGIVNLDLSIKGRDTISIAGNIPIQNVSMYQEFASTSVAAFEDPNAKIKMDYKLNFPIEGEFRLINSQVDARMNGEISMVQFGIEEAVYNGELFITSGKFYYYGDIFNITEGYIALDKKGFNPYLDIHATTEIEGEEIYINLVGEMENPQLVLSSSSGFSQSDILELLTWRKRFEDQEMSSSGFGSQATALVGIWFENQLEKNLLKFTGLKEMGLVEDVSISGTSTLLNPQEDTNVSIKAELTSNVALNYAYRRSFSLSNPENSMLGVELKLNKYVSLVANVDKTGNLHVKYRLRYSY